MEQLVLNKENLRKAYYDDELTQQECADLFGYSKRTIATRMKNYHMVGREERNNKWRQRIANKLIGNINGKDAVFTEERKQKISEANKGNQNCLGRVLSDETKSKIAKSHLKENLSDEALKAYRESAIKRIERQLADGQVVTPSIGLKEKETIDKYEKLLNCKFERQYRVAGFFVDGYCKEKNLVIEVDENYHKKRKEQDIYREEIIKRELKCEILRIRI
jgi:hypothetical protein